MWCVLVLTRPHTPVQQMPKVGVARKIMTPVQQMPKVGVARKIMNAK